MIRRAKCIAKLRQCDVKNDEINRGDKVGELQDKIWQQKAN